KIPVHGLLLNIETGKLDWIVNGYQTLEMAGSQLREPAGPIGQAMQALGDFNIGEMKFPETRIGEFATKAEDWLSKEAGKLEAGAAETMRNVGPIAESAQKIAGQVAAFAEKNWPRPPGQSQRPSAPPKIPLPPPMRPKIIQPRDKR